VTNSVPDPATWTRFCARTKVHLQRGCWYRNYRWMSLPHFTEATAKKTTETFFS